MYVLFVVYNLRTLKGFNFDKTVASVLPTFVSLAELPVPGHQATSREAGQVGQARRMEREPPSKKKRLDMQGDWLDTELEMDAEFEMYGSQETAAHKINAFTFEVHIGTYMPVFYLLTLGV